MSDPEISPANTESRKASKFASWILPSVTLILGILTGITALYTGLIGPTPFGKPSLRCTAQSINLTPTDSQSMALYQFMMSFLSSESQAKAQQLFSNKLSSLGYSDSEIKQLLTSKFPTKPDYERRRVVYGVGIFQSSIFDKFTRTLSTNIMPPAGVILVHLENSGRTDAEVVSVQVTSESSFRDIVVEAPGEEFSVRKDATKAWITFARVNPGAEIDAALWLSTAPTSGPTASNSVEVSYKDGKVLHQNIQSIGPKG